MQQDWLTSLLKFLRLNVGLLVVLLGFFAVVIWGGFRFARTYQASLTTPEVTTVPQEQSAPVATISAVPEIVFTSTSAAIQKIIATPAATLLPSFKPTPSGMPAAQMPSTVKPSPSIAPLAIATPKPQIKPIAPASPSATPQAPKIVAQVVTTPKPTTSSSIATPQPSIIPTPIEQHPVVSDPKTTTGSSVARTYTVVAGDSTWKVAEKLLGDGRHYPAIERSSKLKHNQHLAIGQVLTIPDQKTITALPDRSKITSGVSISVDSKESATVSSQPTEIKTSGTTYTVVAGDSLWKIARKQMGNPYAWESLYNANKKTVGRNPNLIYPGTVLQLPQQPSPSVK